MRRLARTRALLWILLGLSVVVGTALAAALVSADYDSTIRRNKVITRHMVRLLDDSVSRALASADMVARLAGVEANNPAELKSLLSSSAVLDNIYIVDGQGRVAVDVRQRVGVGQSLAERDWVRAVFAGAAKPYYLSAMSGREGDGGLVFTLARPVFDGRGVIAGAVAVSLRSDAFMVLAEDMDPNIRVHLAVLRMDGAVMAADSRGLLTKLLAALLDKEETAKANPGATTTLERRHDSDLDLWLSYRVLTAAPVLVGVGIDVRDGLAGWHQRSVLTVLTAVLLLAVLAGLSLVIAVDLMRDRRALAALTAANRDLSRSNADLERFAYVASHDLKEPLRNIASYVQLLQRRYQGKLDQDADAFIGYTVDGVRRMQLIINELLAYSRIGTGAMIRQPVQTGILVSTALTNLKGLIAEAGAVIDVQGPLPVVSADAGQLASVFQNLIANGLKYRRDDVRPELSVAVADAGANWRFAIRDNGIGIDAQYHAQIFELFKRLHGRDKYSGSGIGLAVCHRVIERHGGDIWVDSVVGQGASFYFTLPKSP